MKRKVLSLLSVLALTVSMAGCTIGSPEVLPGDEVLKHDVVFDDDISDDNPSDIGSTVQASVYEGVYLQDDIGQFDFHSLAVEAVSENELLIQFRLSEGDESGDGASEVFARIFEFDGNDAWVYSSEDQSGAPVVISVTFDDNNAAHVTHENDLWAVNPDGVYAFDEVMEAEFFEEAAVELLRYLPDGIKKDFATGNPYQEIRVSYLGEYCEYYYIGAYDWEINDFDGEFIVKSDLSLVIKLDIQNGPQVIYGSTEEDIDALIDSFAGTSYECTVSNNSYEDIGSVVWQDRVSGRATMEMVQDQETYYIDIYWGDSAAVTHHWSYIGTKSKTNADVIDMNGYYCIEGGADSGLVYEDGKATLTLIDGVYYWNDLEDNAGADCEFVKM